MSSSVAEVTTSSSLPCQAHLEADVSQTGNLFRVLAATKGGGGGRGRNDPLLCLSAPPPPHVKSAAPYSFSNIRVVSCNSMKMQPKVTIRWFIKAHLSGAVGDSPHTLHLAWQDNNILLESGKMGYWVTVSHLSPPPLLF